LIRLLIDYVAYPSLTLATLSNVANALGKKLKVEFVDDLAMA